MLINFLKNKERYKMKFTKFLFKFLNILSTVRCKLKCMNQIIILKGFDDSLVHFETLVKNLKLIGFIL